MRKLFLSFILLGLFFSSASAWETGLVKRIEVHPTSTIIVLDKSGTDVVKAVTADSNQQKLILTLAITAQSQNSTVDMLGEQGVWTRIRLTNQ